MMTSNTLNTPKVELKYFKLMGWFSFFVEILKKKNNFLIDTLALKKLSSFDQLL